MSAAAPNPLLFPVVGILKTVRVQMLFDCQLDIDVSPKMRELTIKAPLFAWHPKHEERRIVLGIGAALEPWRDRMNCRGINLLSVSPDGLAANANGIADRICAHVFRVSPEDLREMVQKGMKPVAISAMTGIEVGEVTRIVTRFYGMTIQELREQAYVG